MTKRLVDKSVQASDLRAEDYIFLSGWEAPRRIRGASNMHTPYKIASHYIVTQVLLSGFDIPVYLLSGINVPKLKIQRYEEVPFTDKEKLEYALPVLREHTKEPWVRQLLSNIEES